MLDPVEVLVMPLVTGLGDGLDGRPEPADPTTVLGRTGPVADEHQQVPGPGISPPKRSCTLRASRCPGPFFDDRRIQANI